MTENQPERLLQDDINELNRAWNEFALAVAHEGMKMLNLINDIAKNLMK